jgi:glycosyltransferase involved in cell wall biosynthesis
MLGRLLRKLPREAVVVVNVPWQWPATAFTQARRVFDCADDWTSISGMRDERVLEIYGRIGAEADAIILANPALKELFPHERTSVVQNGVAEDMLGATRPAPQASRLVHAGTLTPRFDLEFAAALLDELPDWSLDLYGQCQYPRLQERPSPELLSFLARYATRLHWHGVLPRDRLAAAIDDADVALVLNRPEFSAGQDSMKLYDYAARGRPIVTTRFADDLETSGPPHMRIADDARSMAKAVIASAGEPPAMGDERRLWAEKQRWSARWPAWTAAAFGGA